MKIIITGSSGMLGSALCQELFDKYKVVGLDIIKQTTNAKRPTTFIECDITDRKKTVAEIVSVKPDIVIHTAAYTDVDGCEINPKKAQSINVLGTQNVAQACKDCGCLLIYLSTDYVFDGKKDGPYNEQDVPAPLNVYGQTKLEGEKHVQRLLERFFIIRSSWLFGKGGKNFVDNIIKKASEQETIGVVEDQFGSPTYTRHLAEALEKLILLIDRDLKGKKPLGIYHITNNGSCSWFEFARKIIELKRFKNKIEAIGSSEINRAAKRPANSRLDNSRYINFTGFTLPHWEAALKLYLEERP